MEKYEKLRLRKPDETPTYEKLQETLGKSFEKYQMLQDELAGFEMEQNWKYYNCGCKSWMANGQYRWVSARGTEKEKTIYWLSAWDGFFKIVVWFLEKNRAEILTTNLSEETKQKIRDSKVFGAKMQTFPVEFEITNDTPLNDVYTLIRCKKALEAK